MADAALIARARAVIGPSAGRLEDADLGFLIDAAFETISLYANRTFGPPVEATERYNMFYERSTFFSSYPDFVTPNETPVRLRRVPVISITSVFLGDQELEPSTVDDSDGDFYFRERISAGLGAFLIVRDRLRTSSFVSGVDEFLDVTYTAGELAPEAINLAAIRLASETVNRPDSSINSIKTSNQSIGFNDARAAVSEFGGARLSPDIMALIAPYRRMALG